jgi:CubicO group peptidase (beta-lactamase class C family)
MRYRRQASVALFLVAGCGGNSITFAPATSIDEFASQLDQLRASSQIPGLSVVIASDQKVLWARGFGVTDVTTQTPVTPATSFHLASLTKPFAATIVMQLVEAGLVSLDDPVSKYGIFLPGSGTILVRHLMSHTSEGVPGTVFQYNGARFSLLDSVISRTTGTSFAQRLNTRILVPLQLAHTAPNNLSFADFVVTGKDRVQFEANMAKGYTASGSSIVPTAYPSSFSTAAGLIASASDVAAFSIAMDQDQFLSPATKALMYTAARTPAGLALPYGLGWFVREQNGVKILWHYGLWTGISALIIKVPERKLTYVVLANTPALNDRYDIIGDLNNSPWAREFLDAFVFGTLVPPAGGAVIGTPG